MSLMTVFRDKATYCARFEYLIHSHKVFESIFKISLSGSYFKLPEELPSQFSSCNVPQKPPHVCLKLTLVDVLLKLRQLKACTFLKV